MKVSSFEVPIEGVQHAKEKPSKTYYMDWENKRILGKVDGLDAVHQAIMKAILTPRYDCLIYSNQYGSEIERTLLANDVTREYIEVELPRQIEDALMPDTRILAVSDFEIGFERSRVYVSFFVDTVFGAMREQAVI